MDIDSYLQKVEAYLKEADLADVPGWESDLPWELRPLAQGEYNMNFLLEQGSRQWVFRVNIDTQIGSENQIRYEYDTLAMLAGSGFTPKPYFIDDTQSHFDHGVLIMEYIAGDALVYQRDIEKAAGLFAGIHQYSHEIADGRHLIVEQNPLSMTYDECARLLDIYFSSPIAKDEVRAYLEHVIDWASKARQRESYFHENPWWCVINTEVNSSNFIVNRETGSIHLVDWEKPLWGDPSQDLSHFSVPTTTLWKTDYRMGLKERQGFLDAYRQAINDESLAETIEERVNLRDPFNCLRGVSWCAMAWVRYRSGKHALQNADTFAKLDMYLDINFLHSLFDTVLEGKEMQ